MSSSYHRLLTTTTLLAVLFAYSASVIDEDISFEVADDFEVDLDPENSKKLFDIPLHLTANIGRVFHYVLPKDKHITYEAKRMEGKSLPSWLLFDRDSAVLWGVPLSEDEGTVHIIVKSIGSNGTTTNELTLLVRQGAFEEKCPEQEGSTVLSLVLDRDVHAIKPKQRIIAINNIAKFFGLPYSAFTLESYKNANDLADSSVILAGPGTVRVRSSKTTSSILVNVGCDGRLRESAATIVHQLKQQAREGTITEVLRLPLIGWRVHAERATERFRVRRESANAFAGSGDYYDEYYDEYENYDDEYDDDETEIVTPKSTTTKAPRSTTLKTIPITSTTTTTTSTTSTTTTPKSITTHFINTTTAVITSTTSSTLQTTIAQDATSTHHHRHHHGQLPVNPVLFDTTVHRTTTSTTPETSSAMRTTEAVAISSTTASTTSTTSKLEDTSTQKTEIPKPAETSDNLNYDDDDDYDDEDDDDLESETEIPDLGAVDVKPQLEIVTDTESTFIDIATTKSDGVDFIPATNPTSTSTSTTTSSTPTTVASTVTSTSTMPTTVMIETTYAATTIANNPTNTPSTPSSTEKTTTERTTTEQQETTTTIRQTTSVRHLPSSTASTTSTPAPTESIEYETKNFPPTLQNRLKRIATIAGKAFSYIIPLDTFTDIEDGTELVLDLLDSDGKPLNKSSWCQFNKLTREIYGLPLDEDISRWEYLITATDNEGATVQDVVEILVQNHKSKRVVNHEFALYLHIEKKWEFPHDVDWALKTLRGIGQLYRSNLTDIVVRKVNYHSEPVVFVWTNDSLPKNYCPKPEILKLYEVLTANNEGDPSHALTRALIPEMRIKKVLHHFLGVCDSESPKPQPPLLAPITPQTNFSPILRNPVDHINATVNELLVFAVPDDTFYDPEDTDPRNLKMTLLTADRQPIASNNWLQFDSKNKEFYGIPMSIHTGRTEYQLVCEDSGGLPASDSLVVVVHPAPKRHYNVEFSMTLDTHYESFAGSASMQRKFVEKLRDLFGDQNTGHVHLKEIKRGSTIVSWHNTSLRLDECPRAQIKQLESVLVNSDRTIASRVQETMDPEFKVSTIKLQLIGNCKGKPPSPPVHKGVATEEPPLSDHEDYMITYILPAIIIASMLLLAGIVACVMYRRRRSGKMNMEEDGRSSYGNKGIPVIFQEELEEKPEPGTKAPVILKDEKPPLAPPEYSKSGSLKLTDDSEPYQPPPPPFTRPQDNNRQTRPKPTPTYRKPPPLSID